MNPNLVNEIDASLSDWHRTPLCIVISGSSVTVILNFTKKKAAMTSSKRNSKNDVKRLSFRFLRRAESKRFWNSRRLSIHLGA